MSLSFLSAILYESYGNRCQAPGVGDKKAEESRIIDLDQEVIITLNHKKKRYSKMTFEQFRAMMEENMERLKDLDQAEPEEQGDDEQPETDVKMNFSVDVSTPGETKQIAGYNAEKVLMTMNFEMITRKVSQIQLKAEWSSNPLTGSSKNWMVMKNTGPSI